MAEKNKDERTTARSAVENALVKALSDDMGEIPEVSITVEELKALDAADKKKRRKRAARCASVAAVAVIVCAAVVYMAWPETVVPVDADKNTEQRVETGDGEIVINEGEIQGDSGMVEIDEFDWKNIENYRKDVPELGIPHYVPEGYKFKVLHIEIYKEDGFNAEYKFNKGDEELFIKQRKYNKRDVKTVLLEGNAEEIVTKQGKVYILKDDKEPTTIIKQSGASDLTVMGKINTDDLIDIINRIAMP
ncbi:DUF4367 domain-containing protein [Hominibacterium faecale]|uniref:DUF4367 domain-containing protein n=1 Tax=Hominibacterium faecale TaxID=2839743 RepID=UPI0022B2A765|nr:DUF4367 domain-containing protein [Hominibacterium faecale]